MSHANVEIVRRGYEHVKVTGELRAGIVHPDFVWDMAMFAAGPSRRPIRASRAECSSSQTGASRGRNGNLSSRSCATRRDRVVAVLRQRGRSKATGLPAEMHFAQVWTPRDGKQFRMEMYPSPREALEAVGLRE